MVKNNSERVDKELSPLGRAIGKVALAVITAGILGIAPVTWYTAWAYATLEGEVSQIQTELKEHKEIQKKMQEDITNLRIQNARLKNNQKKY